jgi:hypothetical protein
VVVGSVIVPALLFGPGHHCQIDRRLRQPIPFRGSTKPRHAPFPSKIRDVNPAPRFMLGSVLAERGRPWTVTNGTRTPSWR